MTIPGRRANNAPLSKSQTLPRSMGSRSAPIQPVRPFHKLSSTPPAVKKQFSVPGNNNSPAKKPTVATGNSLTAKLCTPSALRSKIWYTL